MVQTMPRALLIVNPQASAVSPESVELVTRALSEAVDVQAVWTEWPGQATGLAAAAADAGADAVFIFSGDGGFNEVLNGVGNDMPVGFIPGGGSSVLPRALGLPREAGAAARRLADASRAGRTRTISLGRANGRRFGFAAAVGFPADVVRRVDELGRSRDGRRPPDRAFALTLVRELAGRRGRIDPALEVTGEGEAAFALVANGDPYTYLARLPLRLAPRARFDDGLDLVAPRAVRPRTIPGLTAAAMFGCTPRARNILYRHDLDRIEIRCREPLPLQVDGEDLGDVDEVIFECERAALTVLV